MQLTVSEFHRIPCFVTCIIVGMGFSGRHGSVLVPRFFFAAALFFDSLRKHWFWFRSLRNKFDVREVFDKWTSHLSWNFIYRNSIKISADSSIRVFSQMVSTCWQICTVRSRCNDVLVFQVVKKLVRLIFYLQEYSYILEMWNRLFDKNMSDVWPSVFEFLA